MVYGSAKKTILARIPRPGFKIEKASRSNQGFNAKTRAWQNNCLASNHASHKNQIIEGSTNEERLIKKIAMVAFFLKP